MAKKKKLVKKSKAVSKTGKKKQKAAASPAADEEESEGEESGSEEGAADDAAALLEKRLAAFGEAFLGNLEGGPVRPLRRPEQTKPKKPVAPAAPSAPEAAGSSTDQVATAPVESPGALRKKRRKAALAAEKAAAAAAAVPPTIQEIIAKLVPGQRVGEEGSVAQEEASTPSKGPTPAARKLEVPAASVRVSAAEKRRFMSGDVAKIRAKATPPPVSRKNRGRKDEEDDPEFQKHMREVMDFITPQLGSRERRLMEERKIRALGGTVDRRQVMPYNVLQRQQKKHHEKRQEILKEEKTLGVSMDVSKHRQVYMVDKLLKDKKERIKEKRKKKDERLYDVGMGAKEKNGIAFIPKKQVRNFTGRNGGAGGGKRK